MRKIMLLAATLAGSWLGQAQAAPFVSAQFSTDAAFLTYLGAQGVTLPADEVFVAQARGGNNRANGDYEIGLHVPPSFTNAGPVGTAGQKVWGTAGGANAFVPFSLTRTGGSVTFAMAGYSGTYGGASALDALGFRVRSESSGNSTEIRNVKLDGNALPGASLLAANGGLDFVVIGGLAGDFTLTGEASLNWATGAIPGGSRLGFQIKGIDGLTPVPEPASAALLLTGMAGLALLRGRRRRTGPARA